MNSEHRESKHKTSKILISKDLLDHSTIHQNVGQEFVVTTVDKLKLCLRNHKEALASRFDWVTPLSVFLTLLTTFVAADFKDAFSLKKEDWRAIFLVGMIVSILWFARCIYRVIKFWKKADEENFIRSLKKNSEETTS